MRYGWPDAWSDKYVVHCNNTHENVHKIIHGGVVEDWDRYATNPGIPSVLHLWQFKNILSIRVPLASPSLCLNCMNHERASRLFDEKLTVVY